MPKSRAFSIFFLKSGEHATTALEAGHNLDSTSFACTSLPQGASLYIADTQPAPPWWKKYFGVSGNLKQSLKAAILFLKASNRTFAITFGHVQHNLKDTSYEHNFGLLVTLNSVDPSKLKSTDSLDPNGEKRQRTQTPIDSDLTYFDFDRDSTILKSLTGKVQAKYENWFRNATGASNIRISSKAGPDELIDLCNELLKLYNSTAYQAVPDFKGLQNIAPVSDPTVIASLDQVLLGQLHARSADVQLSIPGMVDYGSDDLCITFTGAGAGDVYEDVSIENYYKYLAAKAVPNAAIDVDREEGSEKGRKKTLILEFAPNAAEHLAVMFEMSGQLS